MVNRVLEVKRLKIKRRKKFKSFSTQVVNYGLRVPGVVPRIHALNRVGMQEVNPKRDLVVEIRHALQIAMSEDQATRARVLLEHQNLDMKRLVFSSKRVKIFLFFDIGMKNIYLIRFDMRLDLVQRSCNFSTPEQAQDVLARDEVPWVSVTPSS